MTLETPPTTAPTKPTRRSNPFWNGPERRLRAYVRIISFTGILMILALLISFFTVPLAIVLTPDLSFADLTAGTLPDAPLVITANALGVLVATVIALLLGARFLDRRPIAEYGLRFNPAWWLDLSFGLALGAGLMLLIFLIQLSLGWITITGFAAAGTASMSFGPAWGLALLTFISVGIYEELISRGYLIKNMAEWFGGTHARRGIVLAWVLSSAIFGVLHALNPNTTLTSTLMLLLAGLFLGLGYVLTGELAIPIGLHITWNFFQGNVFGFPVSGLPIRTSLIAIEQGGPALWTGGEFGPEAGLLGLLAILLGCALTIGWVRWRYGQVTVARALATPPPQG
ncbi:MAG: CPBP family intramembrane metalloprotease [Chloroflexaceae bacterium]|nr:CPBP family intramembrane metalloprotease [Chloroflexaceae bacterium]